jgi:MFS family permease
MARDSIDPASKARDVMEEELTKEHGDTSSSSQNERAVSEEWREPKPKLNLQMALAFLVSSYLQSLPCQFSNCYSKKLSGELCLGLDDAIQRLYIYSANPVYNTVNNQRDLGPDLNYTWITVSWTLCASIIVSVGGRLSDIFGRRYFMLFGACVNIVGCIVGSTGQTINQMIASGLILGTGSEFQEMSYACIQEIVPNSWRLYVIGEKNLLRLL